jgi:multiple sugar transport system ATP-binding protein
MSPSSSLRSGHAAYCRFNGQEVTATISDRADCKPGDRINLAPDLRRAHLFDAATGSRLAA